MSLMLYLNINLKKDMKIFQSAIFIIIREKGFFNLIKINFYKKKIKMKMMITIMIVIQITMKTKMTMRKKKKMKIIIVIPIITIITITLISILIIIVIIIITTQTIKPNRQITQIKMKTTRLDYPNRQPHPIYPNRILHLLVLTILCRT